jgi:anti-anti-sigma factor
MVGDDWSRIVTVLDGDRARLYVRGDLDSATMAHVAEQLAAACRSAREVLVDLHDVGFCDSWSVGALLQATEECTQHGVRTAIVNASLTARRVFELLGAERMLGLDRHGRV